MKRVTLWGKEFKLEYLQAPSAYIETTMLVDGSWVVLPYEGVNPDVNAYGLTKEQVIQRIRTALIEIWTILKAKFGSQGVTNPISDEPNDIEAFISWVLDSKSILTEGGFTVSL